MTEETLESISDLLYARKLSDVSQPIRSKTLRKIHKYLRNKSSGKGFAYEDLIRIWKGLYYCMYMADKPLFQEELAEKISHLIHELQTNSQKLLFFKVALDTFVREWFGIDKFRMDKFTMLLTRVFRQCLFVLLQLSWPNSEVSQVAEILEKNILTPFDQTNKIPLGIKMHFADITFEELAKVGKEDIPNSVVIYFLVPFLKAFAVSKQHTYINRIRTRVLEYLIKQSEEGIERQEDMTMNELELVQPVKQKKLNVENEDFVMDPRAGGVDVYLPLIKINYKEVADVLIKTGSIPEVNASRRKEMYHIAKLFMAMDTGTYPLNAPQIKLRNPDRKKIVKAAIKRFENNETNSGELTKPTGKRKRKRFVSRRKKFSKKRGRKVSREDVIEQLSQQKMNKKVLLNKLNGLTGELFEKKLPNSESPTPLRNDFEINPINNNCTSKTQKDSSWDVKRIMDKSLEANKIIQGKKRKLKTLKSSKKDTSRENISKKPSSDSPTVSEKGPQNNLISKKRKVNGEMDANIKNKMLKKDGFKTKNTNSAKTAPEKESPWNKPLAQGEFEIFVPSKKTAMKMKNTKKERKLVIKKTPTVNTKGKTLKINLRNNKEHDINDYRKVLKSSPGIPFVAQKKPLNSVLKQSPSPILAKKSCKSRISSIKKKYNIK